MRKFNKAEKKILGDVLVGDVPMESACKVFNTDETTINAWIKELFIGPRTNADDFLEYVNKEVNNHLEWTGAPIEKWIKETAKKFGGTARVTHHGLGYSVRFPQKDGTVIRVTC